MSKQEKYLVIGTRELERECDQSPIFDCYDKAVKWFYDEGHDLRDKLICKVVAEETTTLKEYV